MLANKMVVAGNVVSVDETVVPLADVVVVVVAVKVISSCKEAGVEVTNSKSSSLCCGTCAVVSRIGLRVLGICSTVGTSITDGFRVCLRFFFMIGLNLFLVLKVIFCLFFRISAALLELSLSTALF